MKIKLVVFLLVICGIGMEAAAQTSVNETPYGKTADGKPVKQFTLKNSKGAVAKIITFGGIVTSLKMPDRNGVYGDVVIGYESLKGYESDGFYIGALIGRYANRIANGKFSLGGKSFALAKNNGENSLHGGPKGFHKQIWSGRGFVDKNGANLELTYLSKDLEEGFPGNLSVKVVYSLTENNELKVDYFATSDADTIVNLTQHSYFNLAGKGEILSHQLQINSNQFTPTDKGAIPTGELRSVSQTPFDFNTLTEIGKRINEKDEQLIFGGGYDHNWIINKKNREFGLAAKLFEPKSGRLMEVWTTEAGLQFYSGNFLEKAFKYRSALCLEAQDYPDSPNQAKFPTAELKKGDTYRQTTTYKFSTK